MASNNYKKFNLFYLISVLVLTSLLMPNLSQSQAAGLKVSSENPHFLEYQGQTFMTLPFNINLSGMQHSRQLKTSGVSFSLYTSNRKRCGVTWFDTNNMPYNNGDMSQGFNQSWWNNLANSIANYNNSKIIVIFNLWASTRFEYGLPGENPDAIWESLPEPKPYPKPNCNYDDPNDPKYWAPDRFEASMWSELRGGPIPVDSDPKDNFYTLSGSFAWMQENKNYQEQLIKKVYDTLGSYPNWMLQPMYELDDTGGTSRGKVINWVNQMTDYARSLDAQRPLASCGPLSTGSIAAQTGKFDVLSSEGGTVSKTFPRDVHNTMWSLNKPLVYKGYDPLDKYGVRMDNQKPPWNSYTVENYLADCNCSGWQAKGCGQGGCPDNQMYQTRACNPGIGYNCNLEVIRNFIIQGISPSPFFHLSEYDPNNHLNNYALSLANFLETVETWHDEPGDEIREDTVPAIGMSQCDIDPSLTCDIESICVYAAECGTKLLVDFNCDYKVDIQDFGILLSYWQQRENLNNYQHPQCSRLQNLDLVPDNVINGADIGILLSCWGTPTNPVCFEEVS